MIAPACVIDCSAQAAKDEEFLLTKPPSSKHGKKATGGFRNGDWVLLRTDWSKEGSGAITPI